MCEFYRFSDKFTQNLYEKKKGQKMKPSRRLCMLNSKTYNNFVSRKPKIILVQVNGDVCQPRLRSDES
jgi:hypothetical protein